MILSRAEHRVLDIAALDVAQHNLPGHEETQNTLNSLTIRSRPLARAPVPDWKQDQAETSRLAGKVEP